MRNACTVLGLAALALVLASVEAAPQSSSDAEDWQPAAIPTAGS